MASAADDARAGVLVRRKPYPPGEKGIRMSLAEMSEKIRAGAPTAVMKSYVGNVLRLASFPRSVRAKTAAILEHIRQVTGYAPDAPYTEAIQSAAITLCVDGAPICIPIGDCFPEGTLLLRDDGQLVPIEEIKAGDRIWGRDRWSVVEAKTFKGMLELDAIEMNNGSTVLLTPDHHVYTWRDAELERVRVGDLREGAYMLQPERVAFGEDGPEGDIASRHDRAYVEGLALADGWVQSNTSFRIAGRDGKRKEEQKRKVAAVCERLGIPTAWHKRYITVKDRMWAQRLMQLGARARFKRLETLALDEASAAGYLGGLMADSTQNTNGPGRTYSTTSRMLMVQVRVLHRMFGASTSVRMLTPEQHGGAGKHPLWRVGVRVKERQDGKAEKRLRVRAIERAVRKAQCWDIQTDDHYVYLPEHDVTVSNCDDLTVAGATLLAAAGMQVRLVRQKFGAEDQQHVLCEVLTEDGVWYPFDASHPSMRAGEKARASDETYHDPWDQSTGFDGQAQLVGIGGLPVFMMTEDGWQKLAPETELGATRSHEHWIPAGPGVLRAVRPQAFGAPPPQREQPRRVEIDPRPIDQGGVIGDLIREARSRIAHKRGLGDIVGPMSLGTAAAASGAIVLTSTAIALIIRRARSK